MVVLDVPCQLISLVDCLTNFLLRSLMLNVFEMSSFKLIMIIKLKKSKGKGWQYIQFIERNTVWYTAKGQPGATNTLLTILVTYLIS